jgi:putative nucleotidyltransferase with HDIG domain
MGMSLPATGLPRPDALRLGWYLPLSLAVTVAVTVLPLLAVAQLGLGHTPPAIALHVLVAVMLSLLLARLLAGLWTRHERSSDLVFGDLLIWGWVRRAIAERRLEAASRELAEPLPSGDAHADLLRRMSALLEASDPYTHGHSRRVARHSERIARELGLPDEQVAKIRAAALVHDIGKINVPRRILTKPGRLTDEEFALVKRHAADGAAIVAVLGDAELTAIVRSHHERIDGTGYPDGLAGADIPIGGRIIAVADTFDAITSTRPYRNPRTHKQALDVLQSEAGAQLEAAAVAAFASYYTARRSVGWATLIVAAPQRLLSGLGGVSTGLGAGVAPLAQTACGVGGLALAGVCLGGSPMPAASVDHQAARASGHQVVADAGVARADNSTSGSQTRQKSQPTQRNLGARVNGGGPTAEPGDSVGTPPALRSPSGGESGQSGSGSSSGGGSSGGAVDDVTDTTDVLPVALPDPGEVVDSVTGQLPDVQTPAPVPNVGLP